MASLLKIIINKAQWCKVGAGNFCFCGLAIWHSHSFSFATQFNFLSSICRMAKAFFRQKISVH